MNKHKRDAYQFEDDYVVDDKQSVAVPAMLCDSAGHRPGYWTRPLTDKQVSERLAAFDAKRKSRDDDPDEDDPDDDPDEIASLEDIRRPAIEARNRYVAGLQDAWSQLAPVLSNATPQRLTPGKQTDATKPDDPQSKRDAAYQEYSSSISNAWKSIPGGYPPRGALVAPGPSDLLGAASAGDPATRQRQIEALGERTRGGA
jgi:hypothetical protein